MWIFVMRYILLCSLLTSLTLSTPNRLPPALSDEVYDKLYKILKSGEEVKRSFKETSDERKLKRLVDQKRFV